MHKQLQKDYPGNFYLHIKPFPHHILRENRVLTGAGADRLQTGMQMSFGTAIGRAALVKAGQEIMMVAVQSEKAARLVRTTLHQIKPKLPGSSKISTEQK